MIFLFHLTRFIRKLLLGFVLLLALVVSAARILLPEINEYRAEVVSSLSASIGKPIEMDSMAAGLSGIHPEVVLNGVKIIDPREKKVVLRFEQLRAGLNVREFLATGSFQPRWVTIRGAKLSIRRSLDGSIRLIGLESGEEMPKWIFEDGRFELLDSEVDWQDLEYPTAGLHFSRADIRLLNTEIRHKVAIDVDLPQRFGRSLSIRMDVEGDLLRQECCTGRIYVRARDIRYDRLLEGFSPETNGLPRGKGDFRLWSNWEKSVPLAFVGEAEIRREGWSPASGNGGYSSGIAGLRRLSGVFHWVRDPAGWTFSVRRFALDSGDVSWPLTDWALKMKRNPASEKVAYYFNASYLRLDEIGKLLAESGIATPEYGRTVAALVPGGEIFDLQLGYAESAGNDLLWFLCGRFENVRFKPWQSYPGARNLSGKVCGDRDRGWFQVRATRPQFEVPGVFRAPIDLAILRGNFAWARDEQFVTIRSERVESIAPAFVADFRMRW
ncbi:MAG: YhdP family protein, partial [Gammaproteobacteria bacterium]